jgi:hypothetical protein
MLILQLIFIASATAIVIPENPPPTMQTSESRVTLPVLQSAWAHETFTEHFNIRPSPDQSIGQTPIWPKSVRAFTSPAFLPNEVTDGLRRERREFQILKLERESPSMGLNLKFGRKTSSHSAQ